MKTPIVDFVKNYIESGVSRFHMPGHKGANFLGFEKYDITEVAGADVLSLADGIINESEELASSLFNTAHSFYTTSGSTTAICAMLALVAKGEKPLVLAARNVHKAFIHACALLDIDVDWMSDEHFTHITKCEISAESVEKKIISASKKPVAVYLTSPDYLGNMQNIPEISRVCKKYDIPLLVDNAHGAYLAFLENSIHPIHNGATMCCDSAHKTLPVLTGGAYLHVAKDAPSSFLKNARGRLALFSSTSPSYLILQSLDLCNSYIADNYKERLKKCVEKIDSLKNCISKNGYAVSDSEPLKIVIDAKSSGFSGGELAKKLQSFNAEPEFFDNDFLVLMITPENTDEDFERLKNAFGSLNSNSAICRQNIKLSSPIRKMSIREAVLSEHETLNIDNCLGRICASPTVSCPPAVPIAVSGEEITKEVIDLFKIYGINKVDVIKKRQ